MSNVEQYCPNPWRASKSRRRMLALTMYADGHAPATIARALKLSECAVENVLAAAGQKPWEAR